MKRSVLCLVAGLSVAFGMVSALSAVQAAAAGDQPEVIQARRLPAPVHIDGDLGEWPALIPLEESPTPSWYGPTNLRVWQGNPDGRSLQGDWGGAFAFAWDDHFLYFAGQVTDNIYWAVWNNEYNFPRGDRFRLYLDVTGEKQASPTAGQYMLLVNPLGLAISPMDAPDDAKAIQPSDVKIGVQRVGTGWTIEVAIPKENLPPLQLKTGQTLGVEIVMDDYDSPDGPRTHCIAYFGGQDHWVSARNWGTMRLTE